MPAADTSRKDKEPLPADRVEISASGDAVILRVIGLGNAARSVAVADVGESLIHGGYDRIVVDLGQCRGLDSTFMGTLVALATSIEEARASRSSATNEIPAVSADGPGASGAPDPVPHAVADQQVPQFNLPSTGVPMVLANAPDHVITQMRTLGLLGVDTFKLLDEPVEFPECAMKMLPDKPASQERRLKVIRDAHEKLIHLDERNEARFGPFLRAMLAEMDRQTEGD